MPIWTDLADVVFGIGVACTGLFIAQCVLDFLFSFDAVLTPFLARLLLGDSYQSGVCDLSSAGWVGGVVTLDYGKVITLEHGGNMSGVLARLVRWCTRGAVLINAGALGCVDVW